MCTSPNKSFMREYETEEPRVTPSRHKVQSFSIHNTFETEFMNLEISCSSLCMLGNIMFFLLLSELRTMQKNLCKIIYILGETAFLVNWPQF